MATILLDLMHKKRTYTPLGSISAQEVMNSPRWCEPRIEESLAFGNSELSFSRRKSTKPGEIVEVVHDDGDEEVDHDEGAEEDEGDEVDVGHVGAAALLGVDQLSGCRIPEEVDNVTWFKGISFQTTSETIC